MRKRRGKPSTYVFSARPSDEVFAGVRQVVAKINRDQGAEKYRLAVSARKGKANPHDWKYDNRFARGKRVRIEDADEVDVYITKVPKSPVRRHEPGQG